MPNQDDDDFRYQPLSGVFNPVGVVNERKRIEFHADLNAYAVKLDRAVQLTNPRTVTVVEESTSEAFAEQTARQFPSSGQFWVDYEATTFAGTSVILFNPADAEKIVLISYQGLGRVPRALTQRRQVRFVAQHFTASGSFSVPPGITQVFVRVTGGGGGGAGGGTSGGVQTGGGGGGGGYAEGFLTVTPEDVLTVTVGAGGAGGAGGGTGNVGTAGGSSSISTISATGGGAGQISAGSAGGVGSGGDRNDSLGDGSGRAQDDSGGRGGGPGGRGGSSTGPTPGSDAPGYGGGGGGGSTNAAGGDGKAGIVSVEYMQATEVAPEVTLTRVVFATPGTTTWTLPEGVNTIRVKQIGAGGGGGTGQAPGGGGGGGVAWKTYEGLAGPPDRTIDVIIGAGGAASTGTGTGSTGGSTVFDDSESLDLKVTATGGAGGSDAGPGGAGGTATNGDLNDSLGDGDHGGDEMGGSGGGPGGRGTFGSAAADGAGYGGGGGGGGDGAAAGDGAGGLIVIEYALPVT